MFEVGVDCVNVSRLAGKTSSSKIFTQTEIDYCQSKHRPLEHFAARFAAKEAVIKAISGFKSKYKLIDIEILNNSSGKPYVKLNKKLPNNMSIKISLSHTSDVAIAMAIVYEVPVNI